MQIRARRWLSGTAAAALLFASGCGGTSTTPTAPSPANTTDVFTNTIVQLGSAGSPFKVAAAGEVTITLTSVGPLATMSLGVGIQTSDGTNCLTTMTQNDNARVNAAALQGTAAAGNYCVRVYDSGNIPADGTTVTYTVQVVHP